MPRIILMLLDVRRCSAAKCRSGGVDEGVIANPESPLNASEDGELGDGPFVAEQARTATASPDRTSITRAGLSRPLSTAP